MERKIHYLDDKTRIKAKRYSGSFFGKCYCLQRKGKYFWSTTSWNYVSVLCGSDAAYIIRWLKWAEHGGDEYYEPMKKFKDIES